MGLFDNKSIILKIGDLKSSDTIDTFGESISFNGYQFEPLKDSKNDELLEVSTNLAVGESGKGVSIKKGDIEVFLIYGTNALGSRNAQSMAIGYYDGKDYFFIKENFLMREMNKERPGVSSRSIVKCKSLDKESENDMVKEVFNIYSPKMKENLTIDDKKVLEELTSRIFDIEGGLTKEGLSNLRLVEKFKTRNGRNQVGGRENDD